METVTTAQAYSILGVIDGAILSKTGAITVAYSLVNPEPYTLSEDALEGRHDAFIRALKLPDGTYFHKQDVFLKRVYDGRNIKGSSFIQTAERQHFHGREYLEHHCIISFTLPGLETLEKAYAANPFAYKESLVSKDKESLEKFLDAVEGAVTVINNIQGNKVTSLNDDELKYYIYNFVNGWRPEEGLKEINFSNKLQIGDIQGAFFAICDENYLPESIPITVRDETLSSKSNASLSTSYLEKIGVHLLCDHVYNQIIYFEGDSKLKGELDMRVDSFARAFDMGGKINATYKKLVECRDAVHADQAILCRAHFSLMIFDEDPEGLKKAKDTVREALRLRDLSYYEPGWEGLRDIFIGTIIGRENKLSRSYYFLTELAVALTLFINYSIFRSDQEGILFNDRIYQVPLRLDIWGGGKVGRLPARNGIIIASTGSGKTSASLNIVQQFIEDRVKSIIIEFGNSFEALTRLYPERSAHIQYDGKTPLGINPFYIKDRAELTSDKLLTITYLVMKFWRIKEIREDMKQFVSLTKVLQDYYEQREAGHSFQDFYNFIDKEYEAILKRKDIPAEYFDVKSFRHVCSQFTPGGIYEHVVSGTGATEDTMRGKDFIVFELTKIKKDPFLASIIMTIIFETIESKILSNRSERGVLMLDEYAETALMRDMFSGDDIHGAVAFFYQKVRKENGAIYTIIQSPVQLPAGHYTDGIIANTQILYVLPTTEVVYDSTIEIFHIKNQAHINLMKSIDNDFFGKRPHSEIFIRFQDRYATTVRLELSKEKYYAFQTEGEIWQYLTDQYRLSGNMEVSITELIKSKAHEKRV